MKLLIPSSLVVILLSGCNATTDDLASAKRDGYRCEQVKTLGSSIPKKRCTTAADRKLMADDSTEALRSHQRTGILSGDPR